MSRHGRRVGITTWEECSSGIEHGKSPKLGGFSLLAPNCRIYGVNHLRREPCTCLRSRHNGAESPSHEISGPGSWKPCDSCPMRDIRRAFQRKPFHLWMRETAVARNKRRTLFRRLRNESSSRATASTTWDPLTSEGC